VHGETERKKVPYGASSNIRQCHSHAPVPHLPHNIQTRCLIENLAPIKTIVHQILTDILVAAISRADASSQKEKKEPS